MARLLRSLDGDALADFVEASNEIEGFRVGRYGRQSGHPVFTQHLAAARQVAAGRLLEPLAIHAVLMAGLLPEAGRVRRGPIRIEDCDGAPAGGLVTAMADLAALVAEGPAGTGLSAEDFAWICHHALEVVHPCSDGNGRMGRLFLNGLRQSYGLPWLLLGPTDYGGYAAEIERWHEANPAWAA